MRHTFSLFLYILFCATPLYALNNADIIIKTAALMDIMRSMIDNEEQWPTFKEQRSFIEHKCTTAHCNNVKKILSQCRVIFDTYHHKIKTSTEAETIENTLKSLEDALTINTTTLRVAQLPPLDLDSGVIAINNTDFNITGNNKVTGDEAVGGSLTVTGTTSFVGNVGIGGAPGVAKLVVTGNSQTTGNEAIGGTLTVGGASTFNNTATLNFPVTANSTALFNSTVTIQSTLNVANTATLTGNVGIGGAPGVAKLVVTGNSQTTGNETIGGTLTVTGGSTLTGNVTIGGNLAVTGATDFNGNLTFQPGKTDLNVVGSYPDLGLRIVAGTVNTSTLVKTGGGFTVARNGIGDITITFTQAFTNAPVITATAVDSLNAIKIMAPVAAASVRLNRVSDGLLHFIAIGQS